MKALISPDEVIHSASGTVLGVRVSEVVESEFPVADPLFFVDCEETLVPFDSYYSLETNAILPKPTLPPVIVPTPENGGIVSVLSEV